MLIRSFGYLKLLKYDLTVTERAFVLVEMIAPIVLWFVLKSHSLLNVVFGTISIVFQKKKKNFSRPRRTHERHYDNMSVSIDGAGVPHFNDISALW